MRKFIARLKPTAIAAVFLASVTMTSLAFASSSIGQVKTLEGGATVMRQGETVDLKVGSPLYQKDTVVTDDQGQVGITFIDNSMFSAGPKTELSLDQFRFNTTTHAGAFNANVKRGTLAVVSGKIAKQNPGAMTLKTPSAILGVRGTKFLIEVEGDDQ